MSNAAAAHNEAEPRSLIRDVRNNAKKINVEFIVLEIERETKIKDGATVRCFKVADESGSMAISLWDEMGAPIRPGDIMRLTQGYAGPYRGCLTLYTGRSGDLRKVGEFCKEFSEEPNFSEPNPELLAQESQQHHNKHLHKNQENHQHQQHQNKQQSAAGKQDRNQRGGGGGGGGGNHYTPHQNHPGGNNKNNNKNNNNSQPGTLQSFASKHLAIAPRGDSAFVGGAGRPGGGRNAASQLNATGVVASSATINASRDPRRAKR